MVAAFLLVSGKVQGVFFRRSVQGIALKLGLTGYARNNRDGTVEVFVQGNEDGIKELIGWAEAGGPPRAVVNKVEVKYADIQSLEGFVVE